MNRIKRLAGWALGAAFFTALLVSGFLAMGAEIR